MICQNENCWDKCIDDSQNLEYDVDIFLNMKGEYPNQGKHGLLCAKEKDAIVCQGKNFTLLARI